MGSPASAVLRDAPTSPRAWRTSRLPSTSATSSSASFAPDGSALDCRRPGPSGSAGPSPCPRTRGDLSGFWEIPVHACPAPRLRRDRHTSPMAVCRYCLPRTRSRRLPQQVCFRSSIARPTCSLSTLRGLGRPSTPQDSLPDRWLAFVGAGLGTRWISSQGFEASGHLILLVQTFLTHRVHQVGRQATRRGAQAQR